MPTFRIYYLRKLDYHGEIEIDAADEQAARVKFSNMADEIDECWSDASDQGIEIEEVEVVGDSPLPVKRPLCPKCGSHNITRDASAIWDDNAKAWVLSDLQDAIYCEHCDEQV